MSQERYNTKPTNITGISERNISASQSLNLGRTFLRESVCFLTKYLNATLTMQLQWHFGSNCLIRWTMNVCATVDSLGTSTIAQKAKIVLYFLDSGAALLLLTFPCDFYYTSTRQHMCALRSLWRQTWRKRQEAKNIGVSAYYSCHNGVTMP